MDRTVEHAPREELDPAVTSDAGAPAAVDQGAAASDESPTVEATPAAEQTVPRADEIVPPPPSDRAPPATVFQLGPRANWHPTLSSLFLALVGVGPMVVLGYLLRPVHPLVGIALGLSFAVIAAILPHMKLTVGVDGLSVDRRFFGYDEIAAVRRGDDYGRGIVGLLIVLESGERVQLFSMIREREAMLERITEARARFERLRREIDTAALRKRDRSPSEWVRDLRSIGAGARLDHRTPPVPPEALWQTVESAGAEPAVRAAAAVALRESFDVDGRRRLLEVAETTASPRLRIALQTIAADRDDAAVAEALAAADAATVQNARRRSAG
jgi:hypothetical protein